MPGTTTELALSTAVDSDDNADYLTISLANSLRTVDGLFNNITGHNHGGAHQGGTITPAAGSITSGMIADGTIATADLANAAVTNAKLASDTDRYQLLVNGGMEAWQRGNGPFTTNATYTADRWLLALAGSSTASVSKDSSNADGGTGATAMAVVYTHNAVSDIQQKLEDVLQLRNRTLSLSVRVRTTTPNAVQVAIYDPTNGYRSSSFHTGDGTYQTLTVSAAAIAGAAGGVIVALRFSLSCTAYFDNAMLVVGSQPSDYVPLHPSDETTRLMRYYEAGGTQVSAGYSGTAGAHSLSSVVLRAIKPVVPTITVSGQAYGGGASPSALSTTPYVGMFTPAITAAAAGEIYTSYVWSAEANP